MNLVCKGIGDLSDERIRIINFIMDMNAKGLDYANPKDKTTPLHLINSRNPVSLHMFYAYQLILI